VWRAAQSIAPLEPYWAYPGPAQFARLQRTFAAGAYDRFARIVSRINRALTSESYRSGDVESAGRDEIDIFPADPRQLEDMAANQRERPYFEVLVVAQMTEAQEAALRNEVREAQLALRSQTGFVGSPSAAAGPPA
jgi:arginine decarboxylase